MSAKKSNTLYTLFLIAVIPLFILLFSSFFRANAKSNYSVDYNKIFKMEDYNIKINNAILCTDTNQLYFTFNFKNKVKGEWQEPEILRIVTSIDGSKHEKDFYTDHESDLAKYICALELEDNFDYVQINIISRTTERKLPDTVDEFGDTVEGEIIPAKESEQYVRIDYNDLIRTTSQLKDRIVTSKATPEIPDDAVAEEPEGKGSAESEDTSSEISSSADNSITDTESVTSTVTSTTPPERSTTTTTKAPVVTTTTTQVTTKPTTSSTTTKQGTTQSSTTKAPATTTTKAPATTTTKAPATTTTTKAPAATTTTTKASTTSTTTTTKATTTVVEVIHVYSVRLSTVYENNNVMLSVGSSTTATPVILPDNATDKSVTWKSNRPDRATVDSNGKITAVSPGKAIISCYTNDGGLQAACMVTVL